MYVSKRNFAEKKKQKIYLRVLLQENSSDNHMDIKKMHEIKAESLFESFFSERDRFVPVIVPDGSSSRPSLFLK